MALGWHQLAGAFGKILDRITDPVARIDAQIAKLGKERDEILAQPDSDKGSARLSVITNDLLGLRKKRENLLRQRG